MSVDADVSVKQRLSGTGENTLSDRSLFLIMIVAVTIGPLLFVPLAQPIRDSSGSIDQVFRLLLLMSTMHVGLTAYFYLDSDYRGYVYNNMAFFVYLPFLIIVCSGGLTYFFGEVGLTYLQLFYHAWLLFLYGRQNYGILSFSGVATESGSPLRIEKMALHLVPIGGILGAHNVNSHFKDSIFSPFVETSFQIGIAITLLGISLTAIAVIRHIIFKVSPWRPIILSILTFFYVPTFFFDNYFQAVMGYAIAHALQYFIFMFFLASGKQDGAGPRSVVILGFGMIVTWGLILLTREKAMWGPFEPFMVGAALGLIMWHFVMDAGFWRLRKPWQRDQVRRRFSFLFSR